MTVAVQTLNHDTSGDTDYLKRPLPIHLPLIEVTANELPGSDAEDLIMNKAIYPACPTRLGRDARTLGFCVLAILGERQHLCKVEEYANFDHNTFCGGFFVANAASNVLPSHILHNLTLLHCP